MRTYIVGSSVLLLAWSTVGCSDSGSDSPAAGAGRGGQGTVTTGGTTQTGTGGANSSAGSGQGGTSAKGGTSNATGGSGGGFTNDAACGQRGKATANVTSFTGYEELFLISDGGLGEDICVVRYDLKSVGKAAAGCTDCLWTHEVEYSNPSVVTDVNGACAKSSLGLDAAAIQKLVGTRMSIGYAPELEGAHGSARMKYFEDTKMWDVFGNATWDEAAGAFRYDNRGEVCKY